jgi:hypothetical protein
MRKFFALLACLCGLAFGEEIPKDERCDILFKAPESYRDSLKEFASKEMENGLTIIDSESENRTEVFRCKLIKICESERYCIIHGYLASAYKNIFKMTESKDILYLDSIQKYYAR